MSQATFRVLPVFLIFILTGCDHRPIVQHAMAPKVLHLTWKNHEEDSAAELTDYVLDGRTLGRGKKGVTEFLAILRQVPAGTTVETSWQETGLGGGSSGLPPYQMYDEVYDEFNKIVDERDIRVRNTLGMF